MDSFIYFSLLERFKGKNKYTFDQTNTVRMNDLIFAQSRTDVTFEIEALDQKPTHLDCTFKIERNEEQKNVDILSEMKDYARKLAEPFDIYSLRISREGSIMAVINIKEIQEKWEKVKTKLENDNVFAKLSEKERSMFFSLSESHLADPQEVLKDVLNSPMYGNIFCEIYNRKYENEEIVKYKSRTYPSGFFQGVDIPIDSCFTINQLGESNFEVVFDGTLNNLSYPRKQIATEYKNNYHQLGEPFMFYTFDVKARYIIDQTANLFSEVKIYLSEKVNNSMTFFSEINMRRLNDIN